MGALPLRHAEPDRRDAARWVPWPHPLATPRLRLEPLRVEHAEEMAPLLADERLHAFSGDRPLSVAALRARYARQATGRSPDGRQQWLNWIVRRREDDAALGFAQATLTAGAHGPVAELAWTIAVPHQRRGYAREAAGAAAAWLSGAGVRSLIAHIHPGNEPSMGVARALGLSPTESVLRGEVRWVSDPPGGEPPTRTDL